MMWPTWVSFTFNFFIWLCYKSPCNTWDPGSIPGLERSPGEGNGNPLQSSCLETSMDRGAWWVTVHGDPKELDMTEWPTLSFSLSWGMWDLIPWPWSEPRTPALGAQSLSQGTSREVPKVSHSNQNKYINKCKKVQFMEMWGWAS